MEFRFDEASYTALDMAGVDWRDALDVLTGVRRRMLRHSGPLFWVTGPVRDGRWLMLALVEEPDDLYLLVGARWLDDEERAQAAKLMERRRW